MSSRNMCLLPRATLHSDSEQIQYIYLKDDQYINYSRNNRCIRNVISNIVQVFISILNES
jgi:hypothetical protein